MTLNTACRILLGCASVPMQLRCAVEKVGPAQHGMTHSAAQHGMTHCDGTACTALSRTACPGLCHSARTALLHCSACGSCAITSQHGMTHSTTCLGSFSIACLGLCLCAYTALLSSEALQSCTEHNTAEHRMSHRSMSWVVPPC
jgi:hypothetical protein